MSGPDARVLRGSVRTSGHVGHAGHPDRAGTTEQIVARCTLSDSPKDREFLKLLHNRLLDARKKAGETTGKVSFESFAQSIYAQARKMREKTGCDKVDLRVIVVDHKVTVKARPGR